MNPFITWIIIILFGYLMGSISFGVIIGKMFGNIDIRSRGSGNTGMTNVWRVLGMKPGALVFVGDLAKGAIPAIIGLRFGGEALCALAGTAAMLGHSYPVFFGFRGGRGVSTGLGICLVLQPIAALSAVIAFVVTLIARRMVSLSSITGVTAALLYCLFTRQSVVVRCTVMVFFAIIVLRHIPNIKRIINGTESKISK